MFIICFETNHKHDKYPDKSFNDIVCDHVSLKKKFELLIRIEIICACQIPPTTLLLLPNKQIY